MDKRSLANDVLANNMLPNHELANNMLPNNVLANHELANNMLANNMLPNHELANNMLANNVLANNVLANHVSVHRRYARSVNLERDLQRPEAVAGYVPTEQAVAVLHRLATAIAQPHGPRAWTLTGVYGTGKSAFVHFVTALLAPPGSEMRQQAEQIAIAAFAPALADSGPAPAGEPGRGEPAPVAWAGRRTRRRRSPELAAPMAPTPAVAPVAAPWQQLVALGGDRGWVRAVATGQREPIRQTIARALRNGIEQFWLAHERRDAVGDLTDNLDDIIDGTATAGDRLLLQVLQNLPKRAGGPVWIAIDELGKNLEFAAQAPEQGDLYLLQQLAELRPKGRGAAQQPVVFVGLLHQSFAGYGDRLSATEQSEWVKIQGRFEDIAFQVAPPQMLRLLGQAIALAAPDREGAIQAQAERWAQVLNADGGVAIAPTQWARLYPLHPITALVLPLLCSRYAQHDRSLFSFLTSEEPLGFQDFLRRTVWPEPGAALPTLQPHQVYDYFEQTGSGLASWLNYQRWVEVQGLIAELGDRDPEQVRLLKTIGVLNLVTTLGWVRATPQWVAWALCDHPEATAEQQAWRDRLDALRAKGVITYRAALDEVRLWQGSDFDVAAAIAAARAGDRTAVADGLAAARPLKPVVAQRHYATTGNLRYFQQRYGDDRLDWSTLRCGPEGQANRRTAAYDGVVVVWVDPQPPAVIPARTADDRPVVVVTTAQGATVRSRAREVRALQQIQHQAPELTQDRVAAREVRLQLAQAEAALEAALAAAFAWSSGHNACWVAGESVALGSVRAFQSALSDLCDRVYGQGIRLDHELINRQELTTQGAKARRCLIEAMLAAAAVPDLGLVGFGPEVAIYRSVLRATGIHRRAATGDRWELGPPEPDAGVMPLWAAITAFCEGATTAQRSLSELYALLAGPPYGIRAGVIPVVLAAVLIHRAQDVGVYKDGVFIPVLGPEHFELLVKDPGRFAVKFFAITGVRLTVFRDLEGMLRSPHAQEPAGVRNVSLLMVAKPLFSFARRLPKFTRQTRRLSERSRRVLGVLQTAQEPDVLLFQALPLACDLEPFAPEMAEDGPRVALFRERLVACLRELQVADERLLTDCAGWLAGAFGTGQGRLREDLRSRASPKNPVCTPCLGL